MSSQTPNLNLVLPVGTEKVSRQIINDNNTKIDTAVGANSQAIAKVQNGLAYIVGNTNTTGGTLAVGQFVYVKGHSTIAEGLRTVTASISANGNITTSNTSACSEGGLNALNSNINSKLRTLTSLFEFTGTSAQQISVSGSKNIDEYTLIHFDLYDTNGNIIASLCASPLMLRGLTTHYLYGASTSIWGSFSFSSDSKNVTVNRTSSTTSKFRCYGID